MAGYPKNNGKLEESEGIHNRFDTKVSDGIVMREHKAEAGGCRGVDRANSFAKSKKIILTLIAVLVVCASMSCKANNKTSKASVRSAGTSGDAEAINEPVVENSIDVNALLIKEDVEAVLGITINEVVVEEASYGDFGVTKVSFKGDEMSLLFSVSDTAKKGKAQAAEFYLDLEKKFSTISGQEIVNDVGDKAFFDDNLLRVLKNQTYFSVNVTRADDHQTEREAERSAALVVVSRL